MRLRRSVVVGFVRFRPYFMAPLLAILASCGGQNADTSGAVGGEVRRGVFVDAPVEGLAYRTTTQSGLTDVDGEYRYRDGEILTFSIGAIRLGSVTASPVTTPLMLAPAGSTLDSPSVLNRSRLLLTLDADGDPRNGIQILPSVHTAAANVTTIDFSVATDIFAAEGSPADDFIEMAAPESANDTLVSSQTARADMARTQDQIQQQGVPNRLPRADAGQDRAVLEGASVVLNGGGTDSDGLISGLEWRQVDGPPVDLLAVNGSDVRFTAPAVNATTVLTFELVVADDDGATSRADDVRVTVQNVPASNTVPTANAGPDQSVNEAAAVVLAGAGSDAETAASALAFKWEQVIKSNEPSVTLLDANTATARFTAPVVVADRTFTFRLSVTDAAGAVGVDEMTVQVRDVPGTPQLPVIAIADVSANEGNSGITPFNFNVSLSAASASTVTVQFATGNGSATAGSDYAATSGTLSFSPGETSKTITVNVVGDTTVEPSETFSVTLSNPNNAMLGDGEATGTIQNDDVAPPAAATFSIASPEAITEGNSGTKTVGFTVTRGGDLGREVSIDVATANGSGVNPATAPSDYVSKNQTIFFGPGETARTFDVTINGDTAVEADETFTVTLSNPSAGDTIVAEQGTATGTIQNDDAAPGQASFTVNDVTMNEGNGGVTTFVFTVTRAGEVTTAVSVQAATADGTAKAADPDNDYEPRSATTINFAAGETAKTFEVSINGDIFVEANETFAVNLSNASVNAAIMDGVGDGTITNDDQPGPSSFSVADASVVEGNSGTVNLHFTVTRSGETTTAVSVRAATSDGTAEQPSDYASKTEILEFAAGDTVKMFTVVVNGDVAVEDDETLTVTLDNPGEGNSISDATAVGTVTNDDQPQVPVCVAGKLCVGANKQVITPTQDHIDGVEESRFGAAPKVQKFNLGGFGVNPFQNFPDPFGALAENLTEPAGERVFSGSQGEENTHVRAMTMRQADGPVVVFLMIDAVGAGNVISKNLKARVIQEAATVGVTLLPDNILFGQTHTHAGADLQGLWGGVPQDWIVNTLYVNAAKAVREALLASQPATLSVRQGTALQFNNYRRPRVDAAADADGTLTLLEAKTQGDNPRAIGSLLQYNAHPVSINPEDHPRTPHADYIQGAMDWLESPTTGSGGVALYYNGPIADASGSGARAGCAYPSDNLSGGGAGYGSIRCRGEGIADAAQGFEAVELSPTLNVRHAQATLPVTNPAFVALGLTGTFNRYYDFTPVDTSAVPVVGTMLQTEVGQLTPTAQTAVTRITIGGAQNGLEIVTIPGEATNTFGQYIRGLTSNPRMMLLGLTQNSFGYIIPEDEFSYFEPAVNCIEPSENPFCNAGLLIPFTGYEEFVSLGPLTAPLLRLQGYNPLFDIPQADPRNLPPSLTACIADPNSNACLVARLAQRVDYVQREYAQLCRDNDGPSQFCDALDPDIAPLNELCRSNGLASDVCRIFGPATPGGGGGEVSDADLIQPALEAMIRGCDILDPSHCLFPFPSDHFTVPAADDSPQAAPGGTGKRINFNIAAMPRNIAGKPIDPTEWNRNDGYSPGQMIITYVPNIGTEKKDGKPFGPVKGAVPLTDLSQFDDANAPVIVLDTGPVALPFATPVRHMIWAEIDLNAGQLLPGVGEVPPELAAQLNATRPAARPALIIRPAKNFNEGHRYVVVLRNLLDNSDQPISAQAPFAACRDKFVSILPPVTQRCATLEPVFEDLAAAVPKIERNNSLYLAWDFTTASAKNNVSRLVAMRDQAFAAIGDTDGSAVGEPGYPTGNAPAYSISEVIENPNTRTVRRIKGTVTVPSFVIPADPSPADGNKMLRDQLRAIAEQCDDLSQGNCEIPGLADLGDAFEIAASGSLPPNRLYYDPSDGANPADPQGSVYGDGLPNRNPAGDLSFTFTCNIPRSAVNGADSMSVANEVTPVRPTLYGHGLLGGQGEGDGQASDFGHVYGLMNCAADWFGFASGDLPNVASVLADLSNFPVIPDGSQQGMVNFMMLARLLTHPQGFAADSRFQAAGKPVFDRREVFYHGNSQGGILGGVLVAASKDINRGVLGVLGMNYSTLLTRSTDFTLYSIPLYLAYQDDLDRNFAFSLMQMLWDRSENNGYANHLTDNGAMNGPNNQVLLHPAFGDHQVTMWTADVMARSVGATVDRRRVVGSERHPDVVEFVELTTTDYSDPAHAAGSGLVYWDQPWDSQLSGSCNGSTTAAPPVGNVPPGNAAGNDPHECPRRDAQARCQASHFLLRQTASPGDSTARLLDWQQAQFGSDTGAGCPAVVMTDVPVAGAAPAPTGAPSVFACLMQQDPAVCQAALATLSGVADCGYETLPGVLADAFHGQSEGPIVDYVGGRSNCVYEIAHDAIGAGLAAEFITGLLAMCDTLPAAPACALIRDTGGLGDTVSTPILSESVARGRLEITGTMTGPVQAKMVDGNIADWAGDSPRIAGNESYHGGEHIYTDYLFDSFGADNGDDARRYAALTLLGRVNDRTERVDALQQAGGDQLGVPQPAGSAADHYGDLADREDGTDLTDVRWAADANSLYFLARVSRLTTASNFIVVILADTDPDKKGMTGLNAGLTTDAFDRALVLNDGPPRLIDLTNGQPITATIGAMVNANDYVNALEASMPRSALATTDGDLKVAVMTVRKSGSNYIPANVAYRFNEPVTIFNERAQALRLFAGNVDGFSTTIALSDLTGGKTQTTKPGVGYHERQFISGGNISVEGDTENGRLQPYGLFVPTGAADAPVLNRLTFWTHYRGGKAHSGAAWTPRLIHQLGEEQGNIVVTPRARGTSTWYTTRAHQDVFEVFADIAGTDILGQYAAQNLPAGHGFGTTGLFNIDPSRVYMSGYSMGGYATYLFTGLYPDLFAAGYSTSGAVTQGAWTGLGPDGPVCPSGTNPCFVEANNGRANEQLNYRLLENNRHVPLSIHHGTNDELALTPGALRMGQRLLELQYRYDATTFIGYEHFTQAIVDEWRDGAVFMNQYARPENPRVVTYKVVPALVKAVNEVQRTPASATFNFNPDGAYWVDGLVVRTDADGGNPSAFGQIDATSNKLPAASYIPTPRTGSYVNQDAPQDSYVSTPVFSPANHSTPYVRHGLEWTEIGEEAVSNTFDVSFTNLSAATFNVARMALDTAQRVDGAVTTDGEVTLTFTHVGSATSLCVNEEAVAGAITGTTATATLADAGDYTVSLLPAGQTCGGPGPAPATPDYGPGVLGAIAQFFAELNSALVALVSGDPTGAGAAFMTAFGNFTDNLGDAAGADDPVGDDPAEYAARETAVNRAIEAVVLTGDKIAAWSVPAAVGAPYPYPSGAIITGAILDPIHDNDPTGLAPPGQVRDAHNGVMLYPLPGAPTGKAVSRIAAYRYENGAFDEIAVQVDERFPYFLANAASDFSVYSGTDEELSYAWDTEMWNAFGTGPNAEYPAAKRDPVAGLDHDDEVVFMYKDAGDMAPTGATPADADFDATEGLQEVVLADPLQPGLPKFVYLGLKKPDTLPAFAGAPHYVRYNRDANADQWIDRGSFCDNDPEKLGTSNTGYGPNRSGNVYVDHGVCAAPFGQTQRAGDNPRHSSDRFPRDGVTVETDTYQWRASGRWMVREVKITRPGEVGEYGADLIDRWKGRAFQQSPDSTVSLVGFEDEQVNWEANATLLGERCGPVRCIREVWGADSGTNVTKTETFYRDAVASRYRVRVHPIPPDGLYTNWDYNRSAMIPTEAERAAGVQGGRYFSALRPNGVPVDGINDDVGQIDRLSPDPITGMCITSDGPRPAADFGGICPLFFDAADPTFNLMLAFNNWEQVSGKGNLGSLVYVFELKGPTSFTNPLVVPYYRDDACLDDGTGDDPVARPYPGESSATDPRVKAGYAAAAGKPYEQLRCDERQGAYAAHGVHYFFTHDTDNAFVMGKPITEADAQWWQIMVPTGTPTNVGAEHANTVRVPVQALVTPRPGTGGGAVAAGERGLVQVVMDFIGSVVGAPVNAFNSFIAGLNGLLIGNDNASVLAVAADVAAGNTDGAQGGALGLVNGITDTADAVKAGVGVVDMTPDVGYGAGQYSDANTGAIEGLAGGDVDPYLLSKKQQKSYGVASRLTARAIVIEGSNGKRVVLLKSDNYLAQDNLLRRVGQILEEKGSRIGYDQILHHVSHAHSTTYVSTLAAGVAAFQDVYDARFFEFQARRLAQAVRDAELNLQPARMGATTVRHKIFKGQIVGPTSANDGTPAGYPNEYGDLGLVVMRLQNANTGAPIAVWVNWGEHPEGLDGLDLHSGDFVPFLERFVEREIGVPLVFSQGDVGSAEKSGNDQQRLRDDGTVCQGPGATGGACPDGQGTWRDWNHQGYVQNERNVRFLADAVVKGWKVIGGELPPDAAVAGIKPNNYVPEVQVPLSGDFPVDFRNAWVPGPLSHPYPAVSNCRTERTVQGDTGVVVAGLPDCAREGVPGENPIHDQAHMLYATAKAEGVPVPEHYDAPSFGALEENARIKLQAFRVGDIVLASCACEAQVDLILNFESRADKIENNIYDGFDWACLLPEHEGEPACQTQKAYYDKAEFPVNMQGSLANPVLKARMRAQVHNDAKGWDAPEYVPFANSEPANPTLIKGNFTKEELPANRGYKIAVGVGHAGDYNGYTVSYREYMRGDHYRKALTAYGPHTADYMVTRLVRMAGAMNGAPELVPESHDSAAQADEARQVALTRAHGQTVKNAYEAYYAALPPDIGPHEALTQPRDIGLFNAASFTWRGGSTAMDNPTVKVQREVDGEWTDFADQTGEVQTRIQWPQGIPGAAMTYAGQQEWRWTANFEAYESFPARLGGTPAGRYRFVVNGCINDGSVPDTHVMNRVINFFAGLAPGGLIGAPATCRGGASQYDLTSDVFAVFAEADVVSNVTSDANGDISFSVSPTAIPRTYSSVFPYIRDDNGTKFCEQCSFRPWATDGAAIATVKVNGMDAVQGAGNTWTADTNLAEDQVATIIVTYIGGRVGRPFAYTQPAIEPPPPPVDPLAPLMELIALLEELTGGGAPPDLLAMFRDAVEDTPVQTVAEAACVPDPVSGLVPTHCGLPFVIPAGDEIDAESSGGKTYYVYLSQPEFGGEVIAFSVYEPSRFIGGAHPLVLNGHGFGSTRTRFPSGFYPNCIGGQCGDQYGLGSGAGGLGGDVSEFVKAGFWAIAMDQSGTGESEGVVRFMDPDYEIKKLELVLDWAEENLKQLAYRDENGNTCAQPIDKQSVVGGCNLVLGATGPSYGGGFQFMLAAYDSKQRMDAIVPQITWHDLSRSLFPNDVIKSSYALGLLAASNPSTQGRIDPFIRDEIIKTAQAGRPTEKLKKYFRYHSLAYACGDYSSDYFGFSNDEPEGVTYNDGPFQPLPSRGVGNGGGNDDRLLRSKVDALIWHGQHDAIFSFNEAFDNYACLRRNDADVRLYSYQIGHVFPAGAGLASPPAFGAGAFPSCNDFASCMALFTSGPDVIAEQMATYQEQFGSYSGATGANAITGCGPYGVAEMELNFLRAKLQKHQPSIDAIDPADGGPPGICVALDSSGDAVSLDNIPMDDINPRTNDPKLTPPTAETFPFFPVVATLSTVQAVPVPIHLTTLSSETVLAGIPEITINIQEDLTPRDSAEMLAQTGSMFGVDDPILFLALGRSRANAPYYYQPFCDEYANMGSGFICGPASDVDQLLSVPSNFEVIDDQITPVRGYGEHTLELNGIAERLAAGEQIDLLVYGYHPQYSLSMSRNPAALSVRITGSIKLPLITPGNGPGEAPKLSAANPGGGGGDGLFCDPSGTAPEGFRCFSDIPGIGPIIGNDPPNGVPGPGSGANPPDDGEVGAAYDVPFAPLPDSDPFYAPGDIAGKQPGDIVKSRVRTLMPSGVSLPNEAWQLQYVTRDVNDQLITAVATVIKPQVPSITGAKLVSYQFAYDSLGAQCTPSRTLTGDMSNYNNQAEALAYLPGLITQGWTLVIPDYEGPYHAYGAGKLSGQATLDGIRAAQRFEPLGLNANTPVGLWGYSGGALATSWAASLHPAYAPELDIVGAYSGGTPADVFSVVQASEDSPFFGLIFAAIVGTNRAYPHLLPDALLNDAGRAAINSVKDGCVGGGGPSGNLRQYTTATDPYTTPGALDVRPKVTLPQPNHTPTINMYLFHEQLDELIPIGGTDALVDAWCEDGVKLNYFRSTTGEHIAGSVTGGPSALAYLIGRFADQTVVPPGSRSCNQESPVPALPPGGGNPTDPAAVIEMITDLVPEELPPGDNPLAGAVAPVTAIVRSCSNTPLNFLQGGGYSFCGDVASEVANGLDACVGNPALCPAYMAATCSGYAGNDPSGLSTQLCNTISGFTNR